MQAKNIPKPLVKVPILKRHGGVPPKPFKVGRGFSIGEISALGLTVKEARLLGLYVDERRKSTYPHNIEILSEWLEKLRSGQIEPGSPTLPKLVSIKADLRRVFKGKTMAGKKVRGLLKLKYRWTHDYKWKRKRKERALKKRHEAKRHKGGH